MTHPSSTIHVYDTPKPAPSRRAARWWGPVGLAFAVLAVVALVAYIVFGIYVQTIGGA